MPHLINLCIYFPFVHPNVPVGAQPIAFAAVYWVENVEVFPNFIELREIGVELKIYELISTQ